jgi:hypothetical protein
MRYKGIARWDNRDGARFVPALSMKRIAERSCRWLLAARARHCRVSRSEY